MLPDAAEGRISRTIRQPAANSRSARRTGAGADEILLDRVVVDRARDLAPVFEDETRRAVDAVGTGKGVVARQRRRVAIAARCDRRALDHPVAPDRGLVLGAPDRLGLGRRVATEDGIEKGIDGDVLDRLQRVALEVLAKAAIRIGEDDELAIAVALLPDDRVLQLQALEVDRRQLGDPLLGEVDTRLRVDDAAFDDVARLLVGVEHFMADANLPDARDDRLRDFVDLRKIGQPLGDVLADRRLVGERRRNKACREREGGEGARGEELHVRQESRARAVSQRLSGVRRLTRLSPLLRRSRTGAGSAANNPCNLSVIRSMAQVGPARCRTYRRSNRSSPRLRHGSRASMTSTSAATSARPRLSPCPASGCTT